jgi:hypothetical protein
MNEPGNDLQTDLRSPEDAETVESLRRQINLLFGGLIITSFTLTAYLGLEARRASADLVAIQQNADQVARISQQEGQAMQSDFVKLSEFARTHPDFQKQIFAKYKFNTNSAPAPAKK